MLSLGQQVAQSLTQAVHKLQLIEDQNATSFTVFHSGAQTSRPIWTQPTSDGMRLSTSKLAHPFSRRPNV